MTPLHQRMTDDMTVRGLAENTKKSYLYSVAGLARHYRRSPDRISAPEVQHCLLHLHEQKGLPWQSWETWSRERARLLEMIATRLQRKTAHLAGAEIRRYFKTLLTDRMQSSETDAVSTLARQVGTGEAISSVEACDMLSVLMIAGNETTTNLIGNGMLALARHREQMQLLREEPGRIRDAVNEMLRFDSPVQTDFRIAKAEITVRGRTIQPGDGVILLTGSANRDEAAFEHADTFSTLRAKACGTHRSDTASTNASVPSLRTWKQAPSLPRRSARSAPSNSLRPCSATGDQLLSEVSQHSSSTSNDADMQRPAGTLTPLIPARPNRYFLDESVRSRREGPDGLKL